MWTEGRSEDSPFVFSEVLKSMVVGLESSRKLALRSVRFPSPFDLPGCHSLEEGKEEKSGFPEPGSWVQTPQCPAVSALLPHFQRARPSEAPGKDTPAG